MLKEEEERGKKVGRRRWKKKKWGKYITNSPQKSELRLLRGLSMIYETFWRRRRKKKEKEGEEQQQQQQEQEQEQKQEQQEQDKE